ncbi:hypothetical protein HY256_12130 [Candidatus Sumerlaeota bacterium]|nr:hypothetical protein [Candidatus Sumerlaeota bacterium]
MRNGSEITTGKRALWIAWGIFALHTAGLVLLFDPISGLFNAKPLIEQDYGLHFHHLLSMEEFWKTSHRLWGYSPLFMAGYPSNTIQDASIKLFEILAIFTPGVDSVRAFKWIVFLSTVCAPWMIYGAARALFEGESESRRSSLIAMILGTAYWWNSYPREMFFYGMVGFPAASYWAIFSLGQFLRMVRSRAKSGLIHVLWIISVVLLLPLHLQAAAAIAIPCTIVFGLEFRSATITTRIAIALGILLTLGLNVIWLGPFIAHRGDNISGRLFSEVPFFTSADPLTFIKDYLPFGAYFTFRTSMAEKGLRLFIVIAGVAGFARNFRKGDRLAALALGAGASALFLLTYGGSFVPVFRAWQPLRFKIPMDLLLILGAASWFASPLEVGARVWNRAGAIVVSIAAGLFVVNLISTESRRDMTMRTVPPPEVEAIADWIRSATTGEGRILFEESGEESGYRYGGMYPSSFLAHWTNRQFIGGPANVYNDRHHFAEFHSGRLSKSPVMQIPDDKLREYLRVYNIEAIVAFSPEAINRFSSMTGLISLDRQIGGIAMMKVGQPLSWFAEGEGRSEISAGMIHCSDVRGDVVILKYHWAEGLISSAGTGITPVWIAEGDPIPYIALKAPTAEFVIRLR